MFKKIIIATSLSFSLALASVAVAQTSGGTNNAGASSTNEGLGDSNNTNTKNAPEAKGAIAKEPSKTGTMPDNGTKCPTPSAGSTPSSGTNDTTKPCN